jgi:secreted trypsin-like serine protease
MSSHNRIIFSLLLSFVICSSLAQQKANKKCAEYLKIPNNFQKIGLGIIGGSLSFNNEFPHMVALGYGSNPNFKWLCGGTIISENYILTAAHCTSHQEYGTVKMIRMGVRNLKDDRSATDIGVSKIIKHPNYKPPSQYNDIALLKLKSNIQFSKSMLPACLNTVFDVKPRTSKLTATGWGLLAFAGSSSDNLMKVDLSLYPNRQCRSHYRNVSKRKLLKGIDDSTQICAGGRGKEEKDTCQVLFRYL